MSSMLTPMTLSWQFLSQLPPADVCLEAIVGTLVICLGLVIGSPRPQPIRWHIWAGKFEREGRAGFQDSCGNADIGHHVNPFEILEHRPGFIDVRKRRRLHYEWLESGMKERSVASGGS